MPMWKLKPPSHFPMQFSEGLRYGAKRLTMTPEKQEFTVVIEPAWDERQMKIELTRFKAFRKCLRDSGYAHPCKEIEETFQLRAKAVATLDGWKMQITLKRRGGALEAAEKALREFSQT